MEVIEQRDRWQQAYAAWKSKHSTSADDSLADYPFVENARAPFIPVRRALPMLNLALISSAGAYIDGTDPFEVNQSDGDISFREIQSEVDLSDLRFSARGYNASFVEEDPNVQVPLARLMEFESNRVIGQLNSTFWSFSGFIPDDSRVADVMGPKIVERIERYAVQAALLIPASRLCHQSVALLARLIESAGIPTMTLAVARDVVETVRAPRAAYYKGEFGSVAGKPKWPEHQRRVLDEALRWIEPMDQPGVSKLAVELESQVEMARGER